MSSPVFVVSSSLCWEKNPVDKLDFQYGKIPFLRQYSKESSYFNKNTSGITKRNWEKIITSNMFWFCWTLRVYIYENIFFWGYNPTLTAGGEGNSPQHHLHHLLMSHVFFSFFLNFTSFPWRPDSPCFPQKLFWNAQTKEVVDDLTPLKTN